ncbi:hypothetical protein HYR99_38510, partial [Candidatus Poribacteria bacterium]|nr:hypothetical protein [Candidatus Poribacteria bacterium]
HDLDDVEKLCERVILIDSARILYDGKLVAIRNLLSSDRMLIVDYAEEYADVELRHAVIAHREKTRVHYRFSLAEISTAELIGEMLERFKIVDLSVQEPEIEEVVRAIYERKLSLGD